MLKAPRDICLIFYYVAEKLPFTEHLLYGRHYTKCFIDTISFHFHHWEGTVIVLDLKIKNWDSKRSDNTPNHTAREQRSWASNTCLSDPKAKILTTVMPCPFRRYPEHCHIWPGPGPKSSAFPGHLWWDKEQHIQTDSELGAESEMWDLEATVTGEQRVATFLAPPSVGGLGKLRKQTPKPLLSLRIV